MLTVTIDSKPVLDMLTRLARRMDNLTPVMNDIGMALDTRVRERFETQRDPLGKTWEPWADATKESYPKGGHRRLMDRYGDMLGSLSFRADKTSARIAFSAVASKDGDVYAAYHEWGTRKMPRRGLLFADPDAGTLAPNDERTVLDILEAYLSGAL